MSNLRRKLLKFERRGVWHETRFLLRRDEDLFLFATLNPMVDFMRFFTRWEQFKIGLWFIVGAFLPTREETDE